MQLFGQYLVVSIVLLITLSCSSEDNGAGPAGGDEEITSSTAQHFNDDFDTGTPGARWGCTLPDAPGYFCLWDVVESGPLDPLGNTTSGASSNTTVNDKNYVFQSPDPEAQDSGRGFSCERFTAEFEQQGTFAFNYFVNTAGPAGGIFDGNTLEVNVWRNTVEFDPNFNEDIIIAREKQEQVLLVYGAESSRSITTLLPGHYDFEFCYNRNHTFNIGPDYVQVDDIVTCSDSSCAGRVPEVARCQVDQGATVVSDLNSIPSNIFAVSRVEGTTNRYYIIVDQNVLELISAGLDGRADQFLNELNSEIDGVLNTTYVDGKSCDVDNRVSLLIEMTPQEFLDFLAATGAITALLDALKSAAWSVVTSDNEIIEIIFGPGVRGATQGFADDYLKNFASDLQDSITR